MESYGDVAMIAFAEKHGGKAGVRTRIAVRCRRFAEPMLAWPVVVQRRLRSCREFAR